MDETEDARRALCAIMASNPQTREAIAAVYPETWDTDSQSMREIGRGLSISSAFQPEYLQGMIAQTLDSEIAEDVR